MGRKYQSGASKIRSDLSLYARSYSSYPTTTPPTQANPSHPHPFNLIDVSSINPVTVRLKRFPGAPEMPQPVYATHLSAGADLSSASPEPINLEPGQRVLVPTGWILEIPAGYEGQVRPRSGLALKHGITVANAPGTIDADYRGEVKVILVHLGQEPFTIHFGDRIAQLVIAPVVQASFEVVDSLATTDRGQGGFGSTGH